MLLTEKDTMPDRPVWLLPDRAPPESVSEISHIFSIPAIVAEILVRRGIREPEKAGKFLEASLSDLHDPFMLKDMDHAVKRIRKALLSGEPIAVFGDFDVDGVTSTALMTSFLKDCGADVKTYLPRRLIDGYGLGMHSVDEMASGGIKLIIACDCGTSSILEVKKANSLGIDVVIIDHHRLSSGLPEAEAVINPNRTDCNYPFREMAAVGLCFKLLMALRKTLRETGFFNDRLKEPNLRELMDFVAVGTICDVVPLVDENRILVSQGLRVLAENRRIGFNALKSVSGIEGDISATQVAFKMGPRINAAGRLDDARTALELMLAKDPARARNLADLLDSANTKRQTIEQLMLEEAMIEAARLQPLERGLVLSSAGWHTGVVGIVASRIVEKFRRPALILGEEKGLLKGSGRSVGGFHLYNALLACEKYLDRFGGHKSAAGLQLQSENFEAFRDAFFSYCRENVSDKDMLPVLKLDGGMDPCMINDSLCEAIEKLAPFGAGNPVPLFYSRKTKMDECRLIGKAVAGGQRHVKARVSGVDAIGFGMGNAVSEDGSILDMAFTIGFNQWQGERRVQMVFKSLLPPGTAKFVFRGDFLSENAA